MNCDCGKEIGYDYFLGWAPGHGQYVCKSCFESYEKTHPSHIDTAVSTAIRDTKLSIARELYDEAKKWMPPIVADEYPVDVFDMLNGERFGRLATLSHYANRLALEALGLRGL